MHVEHIERIASGRIGANTTHSQHSYPISLVMDTPPPPPGPLLLPTHQTIRPWIENRSVFLIEGRLPGIFNKISR